MDMNYIYISFIISIIFFIYKHLTSTDKKIILKDSTVIFIISNSTLYFMEQYNKSQEIKTEIFTGQPSF